ncbi:unnamed protein product [Rotaria sp. Silwood1]|nr:unnamed protein product [Rotaria sp. Silwood1]CAF3471189.1 unnamed protein product [Rotaria sp. Silwood1]CAF4651716.1 unnamed protein product [Rotaria sp. Silwood1]
MVQQALENDHISPQIIYTYIQIFYRIETLPNGVKEINLSTFKTELELKNKIKDHYQQSNTIRLLLIRVDYHKEHQHILSLKHVLLNESISKSNRDIWLILYLQHKAFDMFKQGFNEKFDSCQPIHQYVIQLRNLIRAQGSIDQTLTKLEIELLKDWLANNEDSYVEVLILLIENLI